MCCDRVRSAVALLTNVKQNEAILKTCEEIDRLESDADRVMRSAMSKLFRDNIEVRELIKLKAIRSTSGLGPPRQKTPPRTDW